MAGNENTAHWEKSTDAPHGKICFTCGFPAQHVVCKGRKLTRYNKHTRELLVYHINRHSCTLKLNKKERDDYYRGIIAENPGLSVRDLQLHHVNQAVMGQDMEAAVQRGAIMADTCRLRNIKKQMTRAGSTGSAGNNIQAMLDHQKVVGKYDQYLLYEFNLEDMAKKLPEYAFKTSKSALQLALNMDPNRCPKIVVHGEERTNPMTKEYAFFDGQHSRVKGFITLALYTTMAAAKKLVTLARMECRTESSLTVALFFYLFNKALKEFSSDPAATFNPAKICTDMAGANMNGVQQACGMTFWKEKVIGCQLHYLKNMQEHSASLPEGDKRKFQLLSQAVLRATNPVQYNRLMTALLAIACKYKGLEPKVQWWHERRYMNSDVFRGIEGKKTNQAESGHSSYQVTGPMWLVKACQLDASKLLLQEKHIDAFLQGKYHSTGRGPNQKTQHLKGQEEQKRCVQEFDVVLDSISTANKKGQKHPLEYCSSDEDEAAFHFLPPENEPFKAKKNLQKVRKSQPPKPSIPEMMTKRKTEAKKKLFAADLLEKHTEVEYFLDQVKESEARKDTMNKAKKMQEWMQEAIASSDFEPDEDLIEVEAYLAEVESGKETSSIKKKKSAKRRKTDSIPTVGLLKQKTGRKPGPGGFSHLIMQNPKKMNCKPLEVPIKHNPPFIVFLGNPMIRKCQGCITPIPNPARSPENLVITMLGHRPYHSPNGFRDRIGAIYFHLDMVCVRNFDNRIGIRDLTMEVADYLKLDQEHLRHLAELGYLNFIKDSLTTIAE
jgi:hypothetical protein